MSDQTYLVDRPGYYKQQLTIDQKVTLNPICFLTFTSVGLIPTQTQYNMKK